jgi:hypothetical protein
VEDTKMSDMMRIGQNNYIGDFNTGQAERKAPANASDEQAAEWQPADDQVSFQARGGKEKATPRVREEACADTKSSIETKAPGKPLDVSSRVPTTLTMDLEMGTFEIHGAGGIFPGFFATGLNSIESVAAGGIYTMDGEKLA